MSEKQAITIFFDEKALLLTEEKISRPGYVKAGPAVTLEDVLLDLMEPMKQQGILFEVPSLKKAWKRLEETFKILEAAGGLVKNPQGEYLFIFRLGKWDLPKGKREKGETLEHCAVREVQEECGLKRLKVTRQLRSTYHMYYLKGNPVIKKSYWFIMECSERTLTPQTEEDILDAQWMSLDEIKHTVLKNTYASIGDFVRETLFDAG
jgi:ADP-ribose pyrophosphatase YjhB (NUDIX family)